MAINNNIIVGLDIGTTKVCAIVGQMAENGKINVLGMGKAPSQGGVSRGMVANVAKAVTAIQTAVEEAIKQSQVNIKTVLWVLQDITSRACNTAEPSAASSGMLKSPKTNSTSSKQKWKTWHYRPVWKSSMCFRKSIASTVKRESKIL